MSPMRIYLAQLKMPACLCAARGSKKRSFPCACVTVLTDILSSGLISFLISFLTKGYHSFQSIPSCLWKIIGTICVCE